MSSLFLIFPAIDLKGGKVVRLQQGRAEAETVYDDNPAAVARRWAEQGARYLHVVDLDGAFAGAPRNGESVRAILDAVDVPVQLGGGLRTHADVAGMLAMGVGRAVVGTKGSEAPEFVGELVKEFGRRIVVGIDARDGFVAVKGWTEKTAVPAVEFARQMEQLGVTTIVFTDVATDGMLAGPNYTALAGMCAAVKCDIIASGGVGGAGDVHQLRQLAARYSNLAGVIIGKALYDGRVDLRQLTRPVGG